jgi:hypothetical protein
LVNRLRPSSKQSELLRRPCSRSFSPSTAIHAESPLPCITVAGLSPGIRPVGAGLCPPTWVAGVTPAPPMWGRDATGPESPLHPAGRGHRRPSPMRQTPLQEGRWGLAGHRQRSRNPRHNGRCKQGLFKRTALYGPGPGFFRRPGPALFMCLGFVLCFLRGCACV